MGAIMNGLSLSKLRPFGATFFIFSDYARAAIRLSALMELPTIFVLHARRDGRRRGRSDASAGRAPRVAARDSGARHCCARATPTRSSRRTATSCSCAIAPAVLVLSRQPLPTLDRQKYAPAAGRRSRRLRARRRAGRQARGHSHRDRQRAQPRRPGARDARCAEGIRSRVVSMPSWDIFEHQSQEYRDSVLPPEIDGARRDRAGLDVRLGALRRPTGTRHRHADLRRVGAAQGAADRSSASRSRRSSRRPGRSWLADGTVVTTSMIDRPGAQGPG